MMRLLGFGLVATTLVLAANSAHADPCWSCWREVAAHTHYRSIEQFTGFECNDGFSPWAGHCGDRGHTPGNLTWMDWTGGLSESCDDHDHGFYGPNQGEWHGCTMDYSVWESWRQQVSTGSRWVGGVNRWWSAWQAELYEGDHSADQIASLGNRTIYMIDASGRLSDLDGCWIQQHIGTVNWGSFPLWSYIYYGDPYNLVPGATVGVQADGHAGTSCSPEGSMCNPQFCSDLQVGITLHCAYQSECGASPPPPRGPIEN
jgi:hypothetical protein